MEPTAASTSSTDSAGVRPRVPIGRITGAHGLRGQLRAACYADDPGACENLSRVWLANGDAAEGALAYRVEACAPGRSGEIRMRLAGIERREQAEPLIGRTVFAAVSELPPPAEGEFYGFELVGFRAVSREGRTLGRVTGLWDTGAAPLVVIDAESGSEQFVPSGLVLAIDRAERRLVIDAIPGLLREPVAETQDERELR
jgi:16S rRNA processing protein RimM